MIQQYYPFLTVNNKLEGFEMIFLKDKMSGHLSRLSSLYPYYNHSVCTFY